VDEQVLRGLAKWPDVPAVYGWLGLDRRGNWLLQGSPITNPTITAYIGRNYEREADGCWFFQNGPQRAYVELDYTPFIYKAVTPAEAPLAIESHTGKRAALVDGAWMDENGALLLETEHGIGLVDDRDLDIVLAALAGPDGEALSEDALEERLQRVQEREDAPVWLRLGRSSAPVRSIRSSEVPQRFGFVAKPAP
jgi:hypothetical protein